MQKCRNKYRSCSIIWPLLLLSLPFSCLAKCLRGRADESNEYVIAEPGTAPYQVSINHTEQGHLCSGAIFALHWVLSSAQCVHELDWTKARIVAGIQDLLDARQGDIHHIDYVVIHALFDPITRVNDISLIRSRSKFEYTAHVRPITLDWQTPPKDAILRLTGWQWLNIPDENKTQLRSVKLKAMSYRECHKRFVITPKKHIDVGYLCALINNMSGNRLNETGSPLVYNDKLVGISSISAICLYRCNICDPFVASKISYFYDFIIGKTRGCSNCPQIAGYTAAYFQTYF
ncbi:chymotrypsin-1-like [Drosophila novamexicana]|uniref:chymotrypsin-1-like n=1 Tax=Drosophila novamexicana TaxID=47314 RepID=UPI0011E5976B|nr:chymotrypsin-1-like [Drosophila novamexicana]